MEQKEEIILRRKFIGDIPEKEMKLIELACAIEKRSRVSFLRIAGCERAKKIIGEHREKERLIKKKRGDTNGKKRRFFRKINQ